MGKVTTTCLGNYMQELQGQCESCPLALLCIDVTMAADAEYWDSLADKQLEIEEMEAEHGKAQSMQHGWLHP